LIEETSDFTFDISKFVFSITEGSTVGVDDVSAGFVETGVKHNLLWYQIHA
jgi:hypothetical protein